MKRFVNIYISLFSLYFLQGSIYEVGSLLGRILLVAVIGISLYYWVYAMTKMQLPKPLRILSFILVIWTLYGVYPILFGMGRVAFDIAPFYVLKGQYMSMLPIFTFYVFVKKGWLTEKMVQKWTIVFILVAIASYYSNQARLLQEALGRGSRREEFTNNAGYVVVSVMCLIPLFWRKPLGQYIMLGICMLYVFLGMKRGAILAGVVCSFWIIIQSFKSNKKSVGKASRKQVTRLVLTIVLIAGAVYAIQGFMTSSDYFNERLERTLSGDSSGRDAIYEGFYKHIIHETSPIKLLFGNGAFGTLQIGSNFAHNDWLEIAIDNGLVMVLIYAVYWISLFVMMFKSNRSAPTTLMLGSFIIIYFIKSFISMSYSDITPYAACAYGYALANYESRRLSGKSENGFHGNIEN